MNKEDIHISLLKEVMEICGYHKTELEHFNFDELKIDNGYIVITDERLDTDYAFSMKEYIKYHNWWTSVERDRKIKDIFHY